MHPNPAYRQETEERHLAFARTRAFGTLAVNEEARPLLSHIPYLLTEDGAEAHLHLLRSNPIARLGETPAVIAVNGPDGYISPDWYGVPDQVPTWNYVSVHLGGRLEPMPHDTLEDLLARQSAAYEARLAPKPAWTMDKMTDDTKARFLRMIMPFRFRIENVDGTWKLNQNKTPGARLAAAAPVEDGGIGHELAALATLMRDIPTPD